MTAHRLHEASTAAHDLSHLADERWLTRVLVVEPDPGLRAQLTAIVGRDPALDPLAAVAAGRDALDHARRLQPDVVVISRALPDVDGLLLTYKLRAVADPPSVLLLAEAEDPLMAAAATVAGADGLLSERADGAEFRYAVRWLGSGGRWMPEVPPTDLGRLAAPLGLEDTMILRMLVHGIGSIEIEKVLGISGERVAARRWVILQRLRRRL